MRRQLVPAVIAIVLFTVLTLVYAVGTTFVDAVLFHDKADGSFVKDAQGTRRRLEPDRPGLHQGEVLPPAAGGRRLRVGPRLQLRIELRARPTRGLVGKCLPVAEDRQERQSGRRRKGNPVYETNQDGTKVCDPNTVPQRVKAYREENRLAGDTPVPVDAVTASGSGLDPDISVANAKLQAPPCRGGPRPAARTRARARRRRTPTAARSGSSANRP